ncbi:MAG: hypothetical protein K5770_09850 [Lachnospiraceae bacterium]|nr:hypothetical protein [Lachnospiraceae bacterium]
MRKVPAAVLPLILTVSVLLAQIQVFAGGAAIADTGEAADKDTGGAVNATYSETARADAGKTEAETGYTLLPQEVYDGGGLVFQNGDYLFYNDPDDLCFYAENRSSGKKHKLADFPAANINVYNDQLLFTDMSSTVFSVVQSSYISTGRRYLYGGALYRIDGISSLEEGLSVSRIGEKDKDYYRVAYDGYGLYALCKKEDEEAARYVRLDENGLIDGFIAAQEGEAILDVIELEGYLYFEILGSDGISYILCVDRDHGTGRKTVFPGMNMHLISGRIIYWCTEDLYIYAIRPGDEESYVISYFPASSVDTLYDYIICRDEFDRADGINFCISLTSAVSLYDKTFYVPVNGWVNMIEVYEFASPGSDPKPQKTSSSKKPDGGQSSSDLQTGSSSTGSSTAPVQKTRPDPYDAVREAEDLCDYLQHSDMGRLKYNDTPALQERFLDLYFDGDGRDIANLIREACRECVDDVNRKVGGKMSSDQMAEAEDIFFNIIYGYLTSIDFECWLKKEVKEGLAVVTVSSDRRLNIADIYSHVTQIDQIYSIGYRQVDYMYGDFQVDVKASYKEKEDHWRIDRNDIENIIALIFSFDKPPREGGGRPPGTSSTVQGTTSSGTASSGTTSSSTNNPGSSGSSTGSSTEGGDEKGTGREGKSCIPVRDIPDLVFIREKNMVDLSEGFKGNADTESAIRAYKELLEGYSYPAIGVAFKNTADGLNMWFLGDETRKELGEQVKVIRDDLLDDHYEQIKKDPNNKYPDKELEEEKRKDREAFDYLDKLIRDYNPQTLGEYAVALYDGYMDRAGNLWRGLKGLITGKDYQSEYIRDQYEARNRAYNWMMGNIYGEMYDRAKDRIDQDKYRRIKDVSYCLTAH